MKKKYLSLILIVFGSLFFTLVAILLLYTIIPTQWFPFISYNCYETLLHIKETINTIRTEYIIYTIYFMIYILLLSIFIIKLLKYKKLENILITTFILVLFNALIMFQLINMKVDMKDTSIFWCKLTKDICENSYKILNNLDLDEQNATHSKLMIPLEKIKPCFNNEEEYSKNAMKYLEKRVKLNHLQP